jgi:dephospho-CoA kinase
MFRLGLTGNIASGKSTVAAMLADRGARVVDADELAREAVAPGSVALAKIVARFGAAVLHADGSLNRAALRAIVFHDAAARNDLNRIVHPVVGALRAERARVAPTDGVRVLVDDIPLLFESGLEGQFDAVLFVDAPEAVRLARLMQTRGLGEQEARAMMASQGDPAVKRSRATWVVDNGGTREALAEQVGQVWSDVERRLGGPASA